MAALLVQALPSFEEFWKVCRIERWMRLVSVTSPFASRVKRTAVFSPPWWRSIVSLATIVTLGLSFCDHHGHRHRPPGQRREMIDVDRVFAGDDAADA